MCSFVSSEMEGTVIYKALYKLEAVKSAMANLGTVTERRYVFLTILFSAEFIYFELFPKDERALII